MSRVKDTMNALDEIRNLSDIDGVTEEVKIALLGHIAVSLAVIADKMTEKDEVNRMSKFIELKEREHYRGGHISNNMCVSLDDIARVVQCLDNFDCINVVTKDGKIHTINERYNDVVMKIRQAEGCEENG